MKCCYPLISHFATLCAILAISSETQAQGMVKIDKIKPLSSSEITASPWGIQFNPFPFHHNVRYHQLDTRFFLGQTPFLIEKAEELGVKWARLSVDWPSVQDNNGEYHFELTDAAIEPLAKKGVKIYLCLHNGHPKFSGGLPPFSKKQGLGHWLAWVETMVTRYKDHVDYWEIWNEPNYSAFWKPKPSPKEYARLVESTAPLIRKTDPGCKVISGGVARFDLPYLRQLMAEDIAAHIDVLAVHPYNEMPEACVLNIKRPVKTPHWYEKSSHEASGLMELANSGTKKLEVWQGECGYPSGQNSKGWQGNGPWSENIQAKWLLRRALTDLHFGASVSAYFLLREAVSPTNYESLNHKGLIHFGNSGLKKGFFAYQNLTALYNGDFEPLENIEIDCEIVSPGSFEGAKGSNVFTVALQNNRSEKYIAYWLPWRIQDQVRQGSVDITLSGWDKKDPVLVDLLNGDVYSPEVERSTGALSIKNLPISDSPWVLVDPDAIR